MIYITAILGGVLIVTAYRIGLSDGMKISSGKNVSVFKVQHRDKRHVAEESKYNAIMENIENYDGTSKGQKEIKI